MPSVGSLLVGWKAKLLGAGAALAVLAATVTAVYFVAYNRGENKADVAIAQYQGKVSALENEVLKKENEVTERVITNYHTRTIERERLVYRNNDAITRSVPEQHVLSEGWVYAHNQSVKGEVIDPALASRPTPSETTDREALAKVNKNYTIAQQNAEQLTALQTWIKDVTEARDEAIATAP